MGVPIGSGFGASGAGALSLSLALNRLLGLGLSREEAARIAHEADVICKTGLGTVIAETFGGLDLRVKEGAPGIGEVRQIDSNCRHRLVALHYGPLSTKMLLSDLYLRQRVNNVGSTMINDLIQEPSVENFLLYSRRFSEGVGLMTERVMKVVRGMANRGFDCGMAMFGEVVFTLVPTNETEEATIAFQKISPEGDLMTANIDFEGARVM